MGSIRDAGADTPASGGPAIPAPAARSSPRLPSSPGPGNATTPCSYRQQLVNASISLWRDSDRSAAVGAEAPRTSEERARNGNNNGSSSRKRKRMTSRSYFQKFKIVQDANAMDAVVASNPNIVGKENASSERVADSNTSKLSEASRLIEKNKRHSSEDASNVSKRLASGLHETSETVGEQCSTPFSERVCYTGKVRHLSGILGLQETSETVVEQCSTPFSEAGPMLSIECATLSPPLQQLNDTQQKEGVKKQMNTPKNLHDQLEQELSVLIKVLQLPDNVRFMAEQLFEYVLNNHQVVAEPVGILHAFSIALCWRAASLLNYKVDRRESVALAEKRLNCECNEDLVAFMYKKLRILKEKIAYREGETSINGQPVQVEDIRLSWQETSTNSENDQMFQNKEMDLHGKFTNGTSQEISTVAEQMISERQEPVQETHRECHVQNDEITSMIVEKSIDLVGNVFSLREKNILCKQQLEISGLVTHRQNNVIRLKEVCSLVLEHIRRSRIDEMTRREKIKLTAQWFTMLMYAFLEHMKLQHDKLEGLQSGTWSSERLLKESLYQVARSGQLDQDFDQRVTLPDSNFVMEEFIHFKEHNDEYRIVESSVSYCQQLMQDELAEAEDEPEAEDEQNDEHRIVESSVSCFQQSSNAVMEITFVRNEVLSEPISVQAMENEPVETSVRSGGRPTSEALDFPENIISCSSDGIGVQSAGCSSSTIPSNEDSIGQEASSSECRNTEHIKIDSIVKPSMLLGGGTSLVKGVNSNNDETIDTDGNHLESLILASSQSFISLVGAQSVLPCMSPHQSTDLSAQQNVAPLRCPPVEAEHTGLLDLATQAVQDLQPEMQPSILFPDVPLQKIPDHRSQTGVQSDRATGLPQGGAETSLHLRDARMQGQGKGDSNVAVDPVLSESPTYPADSPVTLQVSTEVEIQTDESSMPATQSTSPPSQQSIRASVLQPEVQPSTSMQDEPEEAEDEPAEVERAATLGAIAAQALQPEMQSSTSTQDDLQSEIQPSAPAPAKQNTSLLAQQSLATSQHSPTEAELTDILGTEPACDMQPSLGEVHGQPAEEQSCILGAIATRNLQPDTQPSTSTQSAPFERTHLFVMPVLQSLGSLTAHVLQPEGQPSASMQDQPAEAEVAVMLGSTAAQDLQAELQSSTTVQHVPVETIHPEERRQIGFQPNIMPGLEQPTQHPPVTMLVSNNPVLSNDWLKNELHTLMHCNSLLSKDHEHKKALLVIERNQEIEKVKKKYDSLLQEEDSTYLRTQRGLADIYRKVVAHTSLAENFRREMTPSAPAQGRSARPVIHSSASPAAETAASPVTSSPAVRPPVRNPPGSHVRPSFLAQSSSPSWNTQQQAVLHGNFYGATSSPSVPAPVRSGSYGSAGAQPRAVQPLSSLASNLHTTILPVPPAHLPQGSDGSAGAQLHASARLVQQLRMPRPHAVHTTQQQQPPAASPEVTSSLGSTLGPPNAAPGSQQQAGAQIAAGFESASLNAHLPARLGLGSSPAASVEVVCLSDDES